MIFLPIAIPEIGDLPMASGDSFFEGMDTQIGFLAGSAAFACIAVPYFPMFSGLRQIFPPPVGWGAWPAATLATFTCVALKTYMHTFGREHDIDRAVIQLCGLVWITALLCHFMLLNPPSGYSGPPPGPGLSILFYLALFGIPEFAFSAMQIRSAKRK